MTRRFIVALVVALIACDAVTPPKPDGITPPYDLAGELGEYVVATVDSPHTVITPIGMTSSGVVVGYVGPASEYPLYLSSFDNRRLFRWKDGAFTILDTGATRYLPIATNDSGDIVGTSDSGRPFIWYPGATEPTWLSSAGSPLKPVAINNGREVLLYPTTEYSPGLSVWRSGEVRRPAETGAFEPVGLSENGLILVRLRGVASGGWKVLASPFGSATPKSYFRDCPAAAAYRALQISPAGVVVGEARVRSDSTFTVIDDGEHCSALGIPRTHGARIDDNGMIGGTIDSIERYTGEWAAFAKNGSALAVESLFGGPHLSQQWRFTGAPTYKASGFIGVWGYRQDAVQPRYRVLRRK